MCPHARYLFSRFKAFFCSIRQLNGDNPAVMQRSGRNVVVAAARRHKLRLSCLVHDNILSEHRMYGRLTFKS
jgi:hypothetical protein